MSKHTDTLLAQGIYGDATPKVPLLSERMLGTSCRRGGDVLLDEYAREVAALERQLERGVEGLVPEGWRIKQTLSNPWGTEHYAELSQITTNSSRSGTGPTVEAAVRNAAEKVTK